MMRVLILSEDKVTGTMVVVHQSLGAVIGSIAGCLAVILGVTQHRGPLG